ncbi:hypothetical protein D4R51_00990 [bacterium]|nr:MAG: hypothetical protein D4R51_00990 [bacterium]
MEKELKKILAGEPEEKRGKVERKQRPEETKLLHFMLSKAFDRLHKTGLTTEDERFQDAMGNALNEILNDQGIMEKPGDFTRSNYRNQMAAIIGKSFTPEALAEYELKKKMKGKKYLPLEKTMLTEVIDETIERVCLIMENKNLDADKDLQTSEKLIPSDFSERDIGKVRRLIKSVLTKVLTKNKVNPEGQEKYVKDLTPLMLDSLKKRPPNPTEMILKNLYEK